MAKKFKKTRVNGLTIYQPVTKWESPMKERSPRAAVFGSDKYYTKSGRSKAKAQLKKEVLA